MRILLLIMTFSVISPLCFADKEMPPRAVVFSNDTGYYYVKSVAKSREDQYAGVTRVYRTKSDKDELLCEYKWYASRLWLFFDGNDLTLIRLGPWHRTGNAPEKELEIGFYKKGKVIKEYTAADIAVKKENFQHSTSHYSITNRVKGIVVGEQANYFEIRTFDGRNLRFDLSNGKPLQTVNKTPARTPKRTPKRRLRGGSFPPCDKTGRKPVLDQTQLVHNGGLSARTLSGYSHWQSFTPSISGKLVQIDMAFFTKIRGDGTLALHFGKGVKDECLHSGPVSVTAAEWGASWNSYSLNVDVTAGKPYTFHFTPNPSTMPDPYGVCIGGKASLYKRGAFTLIDPSGEYTFSLQSVFRTYVIPNTSPPARKITPAKSVQSSTKIFEAKK